MSKKLIGLVSLFAVMGLVLAPCFVLAADLGDTDVEPIKAKAPEDYTKEQALEILPRIINWVFGFLLAVVTLMIIIAAYMFVTAGGNPENVGKARNMLMYALIGLAIGIMVKGLIALLEMILGKSYT